MADLDRPDSRENTVSSVPLGADQGRAKPDVAVIIVTYKTAHLAVESLRSVDQERRIANSIGIRAVIVDNASGDLPAIADAVQKHDWSSWVTLVSAPKNGGFAYGNNLGIERAFVDGAPDFIYLLNPDAQVRPDAIGTLVRFLESHLSVGIAGSSFENLDGSDWPISFRFPTMFSEVEQGLRFSLTTRLLNRWVVARRMTKTSQPVDWICGASMMIRQSVLRTVGGLDENYFLYFEETDFCWRSRRVGIATWYVPESRVMHIAGQSTKVTDVKDCPTRLPTYWFESRRRYYAVRFGVWGAAAIDVVAIVAYSLGALKRIALLSRNTAVPHFIRDLMRNSVLWPRNRNIPAPQCPTFGQGH
jgi:N-acetylglucosaminyl-diphospho-decaprenol L-rhamnosyltransferase